MSVLRLHDTEVVHRAGRNQGTVAPRWQDVRVPLTSARAGLTNPPDLEVFRGSVRAMAFSPTLTEDVFFDMQVPHGWVPGDVRPHVHWSPGSSTNTGTVAWRLDYTWASVGDTFAAPVTLSADQAAAGVAYGHQIVGFGSIDGSGQRDSSVLLCRLYRLGGDASDTFTGDAFALSVDVHLQVTEPGSEQEYPT